MQEIHTPERIGALSGAVLTDWRPEDKEFWQATGPRDRSAQSLDFDPGALAVVRDLAGLVGRGREAAVGRLPVHNRSAVLARCASRNFRRRAANLLFFHGADLRRATVDHGRDVVADDPGRRHRLRGAESGHALFHLSRARSAVRAGWRQLRLVDGQYLVLLPTRRKGQCARSKCRARQSRRQRRAIRGADRDHGRRLRLVRRRAGDGEERHAASSALAAECRLHLGAVHRSERVLCLVRHERHRSRQGIVQRTGRHLPAQAQLADVLALYRNLRLIHRLFGRIPASCQDCSSHR